MPHLPEVGEDGFDGHVSYTLQRLFPEADIAYQVYLPESRRYVDFVVSLDTPSVPPAVSWIVESEDDFEGIVSSVGQVEMYAGLYETAIPVVAYPEGHVEQPEFDALCEQSPVLFLPVDTPDE